MSVWNINLKSSSQRLLLLCLNDNKDVYSKCSLSISKMCELTLLNRKTIMKALDDLEMLNIIKFTGKTSKFGVKEYEVFVQDHKINKPTDNGENNKAVISQELWDEFIKVRKSKGIHYTSKQDEFNIKNEIIKAVELTGDSADDVISLAISRQWKFIRAEWYVQAISKNVNTNVTNIVSNNDEIKKAYLDATQGIFKTNMALQVAKIVGEWELRTTPEKYIYRKWVSAYNDVKNSPNSLKKDLHPVGESDKINTESKKVIDDNFVSETLLNIKRIIGRVK